MGYRVLAFTRRMHVSRVERVVSALVENSDIDLVSDERIPIRKVLWWGMFFYDESYYDWDGGEILQKIDVYDVIARCRFLREKRTSEAYNLVFRAVYAWSRIIKEGQYDLILNLPVDSFVTHTLYLVADALYVPSFTIQSTQFSGKVRFTRYGDIISDHSEQASENEFFSYVNKIEEGYVPDYLTKAQGYYWMLGLKRLIIDSLKRPGYWLYRVLSRDNETFSFSAWKYQMALMMATPARFLAILKSELGAVSKIEDLPHNFVFIPLQFYPESTNDYWIGEKSIANHHLTVLQVVDLLRGKYPVVIKEHPACYAKRDAFFLNELRKRKNVFFVKTEFSVGEVVKRSSFVIGYASSTLMEAILMRKKVVFLGESYYGTGGYPVIKNIDELECALNVLEKVDEEVARREFVSELYEYFKSCFNGSIGYYAPLGERCSLSKDCFFSLNAKRFVVDCIEKFKLVRQLQAN